MSDEPNDRVDAIEQRLDRIAEGQVRGFTSVADAIGRLERRQDASDGRLDLIVGRVDTLTGAVGTLTERVDKMAGDQVRGFTAVVEAIGAMRGDLRDGHGACSRARTSPANAVGSHAGTPDGRSIGKR